MEGEEPIEPNEPYKENRSDNTPGNPACSVPPQINFSFQIFPFWAVCHEGFIELKLEAEVGLLNSVALHW